ncbi:acVLRF1 family peptidyl-tRNA hydrolase [Kibdelosporangium lantanae]
MSRTRDVPGGGRAVEVAPERVAGWFDRFAERHGGISLTVFESDRVTVTAGDGSVATVAVPFGPLAATDMPGFVAHLCRPRRIGLLLVRLGGHSVGIATSGRVEISRSGRKPVHGRNSAGGWSQQRFARRREGQARQAFQAAARDAYEVLVPRLSEVDSVVLGGDQHALAVLRADPRLAGIFARAGARVLDVGEPRRATLDEAAERARAVEIVVHETP